MQPRVRRILATAAILAALIPLGSGYLGLGRDALIVAASAPKAASGMTLFVVSDHLLASALGGERAEYAIYYGDRLVYPPGGKGAGFPIDGRTGTLFIPYGQFVVGNGDYDIVIRYMGAESRVRVNVQKWVEYVYLHPFDMGGHLQVDVALSSATGGHPADRILAEGELHLEIRYRGLDGEQDRLIGMHTTTTRHDRTSTSVLIPKTKLTAGPGYYSFEPLFHNNEARNNAQVSADPTLANRNPPWNWYYHSP